MKEQQFDVVVIGAGNGGLGAALSLAAQGLKPLVIEQHNLPGGCATSFVRGRFEFDASLHVLFYDRPQFRQNWESFGLTEQFSKVPPVFTNAYTDENGNKVCQVLPLGVPEFIKAVAVEYPDGVASLQKFIGVCAEIARGTAAKATMDAAAFDEQFPHYKQFVTMTLQQAYDALDVATEIRSLMSILWFYEGPSVAEMPMALYANVVMAFLSMDCYFPNHACHGFNAEFESIIRKQGGEIWYNTTVEKIYVSDGRVVAVETDRGDCIKTRYVVSNAAPKVVYGKMITPKEAIDEQLVEIENSVPDNMSFAVVYLGLDRSAEELGIRSHHIFVNESSDPIKTYEASFTLDGPYCMGLLCPNLTVEGYSPEGTCVVSIAVPMRGCALEGLDQKGYFAAKERFAYNVVKSAGEHLGVDFLSHIEEIEVALPATFSRYAGLPNGALGYAMNTLASSKSRYATYASQKGSSGDAPVKGLAFVGQFAHGIGYPNNPIGIGVGAAVAAAMKEEG